MSDAFRKRGGTTNQGGDYELYNVANIVLNLVSDKNVNDFYISSNDANYGAFDDIVVDYESNGNIDSYAIQLKHSDKKHLTKAHFNEIKKGVEGDFCISKYFTSFLNIKSDVQNYILFTNVKLAGEQSLDIQIKNEKFTIKPVKTSRNAVDYINTSNSDHYCYQFVIENPPTDGESQTYKEFKSFLEKFFLYVSQQSVSSLKIDIRKKFRQILLSDEFDKFFKVISEWSFETGFKEKLHKEWMQYALTIHILSSRIKPLSFCETNDNMKILREAIALFDVTLIGDEKSCKIMRELWGDIKNNFDDVGEINKIMKKYQLRSFPTRNIEDINPELASKLMWILNKCPLIVKKDETVQKVIDICGKTNLIVIDENLYKGWLNEFSIFQNLSDLKSKNSDTFNDVINKFTCSFQGKNPFALKKLANEEFLNFITTDDLLEMLKGPLNLGGDKEKLCDPYIQRLLFRNIIDIKYLENVKSEIFIIIDCIKNIKLLNNKFSQHEFINIDDHLDDDKRLDEKCARHLKITLADLSIKYSTGSTIVISQTAIDIHQFKKICEKNKDRKIVHHFRFRNDNLEWIRSRGGIEDLEKYRLYNNSFVPEKSLFGLNPENNLNVIVGDPGIGKSELMKSLKNNCLDTFWTVVLHPNDVTHFQSLEEISFEKLITDIKFYSAKCQKLFNILAKQNKAVFVWDALDEIAGRSLREVIKIIKTFSKKGYIQWITSRCNLKVSLENEFKVLSISVDKFSKHDQYFYIYRRLQDKSDLDKIINIIDKLKSTFLLSEHMNILGIPLQLFILTELFRQDIDGYLEKLTKSFLLTDLYYYFIDQKFVTYAKDKLQLNMEKLDMEPIMECYKADPLKYFQISALINLLPEDILEKLKLNYEECLKETKKYIHLGVVTEIVNDLPVFVHGSFTEYLIAFYFSEHLELKSRLNDFIFAEKFTNVRFLFDLLLAKDCEPHVACLYKNYNLLLSYETEIATAKDKGGRTVLHLASSWGKRCPRLPVQQTGDTFVIDDQDALNLESENSDFRQMYQHLLNTCNSNETDFLFNMNCLSYARQPNCVFPQIKLIYDQKSKLNESAEDAVLLYYSALFGYDEVLEMIDTRKLDVFKTKYKRNSLIHLAAQHTNFMLKVAKIVKQNIPTSDWFNKQNGDGETALAIASEYGHDQIVELLVVEGAEINRVDKDGFSPLLLACQMGHDRVVECLVTNDAEINLAEKHGWTPLQVASSKGHGKIVKCLVANDAKMNMANKDGATPLYVASQNGHVPIVAFLAENGAEINVAIDDGWTPLHIASQKGHDEIVEILIEKGGDVNRVNTDEWTPLHVACQGGHEEITKFLALKFVDINLTEKDGWTPLHIASRNGHIEIVKFCVENGAAINVPTNSGRTPLYIASEKGHERVVQFLVEQAADINIANEEGITPLYVASQEGHRAIVEILATSGAEINCADKRGITPLHRATYQGHDYIVEFLVTKNANINLGDKDRITPLYIASQKGHDRIVEFLLTKSVQINHTAENGLTPLHIASDNGHDTIVKLLVENDADINLADKDGFTALHMTAENGHDQIVKFLVVKNAAIDAKTHNDKTPLHIATVEGNGKIVEFLVANGAGINLADKDGFTPLHLASHNGDERILEFLVENGADINCSSNDGRTPVFTACFYGHKGIVELLVRKGTDVNHADQDGVTPLHMASFSGQEEVVEFLVSSNAEINNTTEGGVTPLYEASSNGHDKVVEFLLTNGADINVADNDSVTPLYVASQNGHHGIVKLLVASGAEIDFSNETGWTPLHVACQNGYYETVEFLLMSGAEINLGDEDGTAPLHIACCHGQKKIVELLVQSGADINVTEKDGTTPVSYAFKEGHEEIFNFLRANGAEFDPSV